MYDADGQELARDGLAAARVLLTNQTPVGIVPPLSPDELLNVETDPPPADRHPDRPAPLVQARVASSQTTSTNHQQQEKYTRVNRFLWFHYTPR